ncbi:MAG: FHA domain-containing protein [Microbacteriaceae bacterium]
MSKNVPAYPIVHVTIRPDGSAHVNVAGRHVDYPPDNPDETRVRILAYAVEVAKNLGRGVRVRSSEPQGTYELVVTPSGDVELLEPATARPKADPPTTPRTRVVQVGNRQPAAAPQPAPTATSAPVAVLPDPPAPEPVDSTVLIARTTATVTFSTGDVAVIGPAAIVGRKPAASDTEWNGIQLVTIHDPTRQVSRVHCSIAWRGGRLVVTDRGASNGTAITRPPAGRYELEREASAELLDGDVLHLGPSVHGVVTVATPAGGTR